MPKTRSIVKFLKRAARPAGVVAAFVGLVVATYVVYVYVGLHAAPQVEGTVRTAGVREPVTIYRDARGVPHIRAQNDRDLYFADGYVQGSDRLFQLDLMRRYALGTLSEIFGKPALKTDETTRSVPVEQIVERQYKALAPQERAMLAAFSDGVNFAMQHEPTPVEFRILLYTMQKWRPQDSLAIDFAIRIGLVDSWKDVAHRVGRHLPLSDPCFDAPVLAGLRHIADAERCVRSRGYAVTLRELRNPMLKLGSNAWAAGSVRTAGGRALIANDPHLGLMIPGIWYLVELAAPGLHVAGAALPGTPGVILGHNEHLAWGVTNADVAALSVYDAPHDLDPAGWQREIFHVRLGGDVVRRYYRTADLFGLHVALPNGQNRFVLVRWSAYTDRRSPLQTFEQLDRAQSVEAGLRALRTFPGPPLDVLLADTGGRVAYHLAGEIPNDPLWARGFHSASDLKQRYPPLPFDVLPGVAPSRSRVLWSASNKMYAAGYPYRLSGRFTPPYRAYRIAQLLRARQSYTLNYFARMQMDVLSVAERQVAQHDDALRAWNGAFTPDSRDATRAHGLLMQLRAHRADPQAASTENVQPWGVAGAVTVRHPLAAIGFLSFLNGTTLPGDGDLYTIHLQHAKFAQSFRAVWDVGNWDAGGITLPQGESGEEGSGHYVDEANAWVRGDLIALPFSDRAVRRDAVHRLTLVP